MKNNLKQFASNVIIIAIVATASILFIKYFESIGNILLNTINITAPFIYGGVIAYISTPLCNSINNKINNDKLSILATMLIGVLIAVILCILIIPQTVTSLLVVIEEMPATFKKLQIFIDDIIADNLWLQVIIGDNHQNSEDLINSALKLGIIPNIKLIAANIASGATSILKFILNIIIGCIASVLMLANRKRFAKHTKIMIHSIFGDKISNIIFDEAKVANKMFSGFLFGKLIDSTIIGVICFIVLSIMGMKYALLISVIVGVTNIIPIVGPFIGAVPGVIIEFSESPEKAMYFLIFIVILQQIDGNIIGPKCIGTSTGLDTFWVLFAIIFFGGLWGIVGMVIGVPVLAVIFDIGKKVFAYLDNKQITKTSDIEKSIK